MSCNCFYFIRICSFLGPDGVQLQKDPLNLSGKKPCICFDMKGHISGCFRPEDEAVT